MVEISIIMIVTLSVIFGIIIGVYVPVLGKRVITTTDNIDNLKTDCYVQGVIDGRASRLAEESAIGKEYIKPDYIGIPKGYISDRTTDWRMYADNIVPHIDNSNLSVYKKVK